MYKGCATSDGCADVDGFGHFFEVNAFLEAFAAVCIDTVWALYRMGDGQSDECFFPDGQGTLFEYRAIIRKKLLCEGIVAFADVSEVCEMIFIVIVLCHLDLVL
jgi:hypothetical protein